MPSRSKPDPAPAISTDKTLSGLSWQVIAALVVVVVAIAAVVTLGVTKDSHPVLATGPVPVAAVGQPGANSAACRALMAKLPTDLSGSKERAVEGGGNQSVAAWGDPAVILRCGLETPQELNCSSALTQVDDVAWLQLADDGSPATTYIAADRSVRIAVTLPSGSGTGQIQEISDVISATLEARQPCSNGVLLPTDIK
jgi:hypothetical protein